MAWLDKRPHCKTLFRAQHIFLNLFARRKLKRGWLGPILIGAFKIGVLRWLAGSGSPKDIELSAGQSPEDAHPLAADRNRSQHGGLHLEVTFSVEVEGKERRGTGPRDQEQATP